MPPQTMNEYDAIEALATITSGIATMHTLQQLPMTREICEDPLENFPIVVA